MNASLHYRRYRLPFRAPVRTAHGIWAERQGLIVRLEDETGNRSYGECAPIPEFGTETVDDAEAACRNLGEKINDERVAALPPGFGCVRNALANARADLMAGKEASANATSRVSVAGEKLEGRTYLGVAALLPAGRPALIAVPPKVEIGFRVFKWKVGVGDIGDELALLDDLCAALPSGAKLRLDANGAWDRRRAERWLERCADRPIEFVEQPVAAGTRGEADLLLGLAGDFPTPIALDESLIGDGDVERWLGSGWPGVFVIKPSLLGHVSLAIERLAKAQARVVFSSALETAVGARAALRMALAWPGEPRAVGFGVWPLFADARFDGPAAAPFVRAEDIERINPEALWEALA